ncbi:MAG: hypothetical protein LBT36_03685 [Oscillospiraceae bacterium]|jgi:hypothetical protein|nr:hypothetical protein [Oscillospiraceae bacterium]
MKGKNAGRTAIGALKSYGIGVAIFAMILVVLLRGLTSTETASQTEQLHMLEDNIRRAMVSCYAMEGSYPESLEYMIINYGVRIDPNKFTVNYFVFASNIMPDYDVREVIR